MTEQKKQMLIDTIDRQRKYVKAQKEQGGGLGLVFADAFLRGMRDLGYKSPSWALAELVDNSFQAAANTVAIRLGFNPDNKSKAKPDMVAICDNGNGMIKEMLSYAVRWGGTDREGDRSGFGRYGYGLPSASVSLAKRYTVYSRPEGGDWHAVTLDIDELAAVAASVEKTRALLTAKPATPPDWIDQAGGGDDKLQVSKLRSGTIVVLEDLDRLKRLTGWIMAKSLTSKLLQHLGVIYRHWVPDRRITVNGALAQAVDPLFLMEHARFHDETPVHAQKAETRTFEIETLRGTKGTITIRASLLPPNFQLVDQGQYGQKGAKTNKRLEIMKDYNGLLICRERRQIDCIAPKWTTFQNLDRNVKVEIDFDPELDEYFGITTSKQQISIDDEMWDRLRANGPNCGALYDLVKDLRQEFEKLQDGLKADHENSTDKTKPRPSSAAMEKSTKFKGTAVEITPAQAEEGKTNLENAAAKGAKGSGTPKEKVLEILAEETKTHKWFVEFGAIPEGPFYRPIRFGEQKRVLVNTDHPFYSKLYSQGSAEVRAATEVLLFVLADRELDANGDASIFYKAERQKWSERLRYALDCLDGDDMLVDKAAAVAEKMHLSAAESESAVQPTE